MVIGVVINYLTVLEETTGEKFPFIQSAD